MENATNYRDIKIVITNKQINKLVSETNYHTTKHISENLLIIEMKKTEVKMNKSAYLGLSILDIIKTNIYKFWCGYITLKYGGRAKLCYTDTDSFVIDIKPEDFYEDVVNDVERWFDISNYDENDERPLPIGKNKKVISLFKDELRGKIIIEFFVLRAKAYAYLMKDGGKHKKAKGTKKCVIKRQLMFENYKDS